MHELNNLFDNYLANKDEQLAILKELAELMFLLKDLGNIKEIKKTII